MTPVPCFFAKSATTQLGASAEGDAVPITVRTPAEQWAYALSFRRAGTFPEAPVLAVHLRIVVTEGTVGVGWLNASRKQFVDEVAVAAGPEVSVELLATHPFDLGPLMIRNWSSDGPSTASVLGIECFSIDAEEANETDSDTAREPPLSEPVVVPDWSRYYGSRGYGLRERARVRRFESLVEPTILTWSDRLSLQILPGDQLSRAVYVSGTYEPNTLCVLRSLLKPGAVCLDVGANAGVVALAASRWVEPGGRIFAFEPSSREFARLCDSIERSHVANVTPIHVAVSDHAGAAMLRVAAAGHGGLNTLGKRFAYEGVETLALEQVEVTTLDDFMLSERIERVSVVKLDVEGGEGAVLAGSPRLLADHRPALILEVNPRALEAHRWTVTDVEDLLKSAGYRLFSIRGDTAALEPTTRLTVAEEQNIVALPGESRELQADIAGAARSFA